MIGSRLRHWALMVVTAGAMFGVVPAPSRACSCAAGTPPIDTEFTGRVIAVFDAAWVGKALIVTSHFTGSYVALLAVDRTLHGPRVRLRAVTGGSGQGDCAIPFAVGETYMVQGQRRAFGLLDTNSCLGTHRLALAAG